MARWARRGECRSSPVSITAGATARPYPAAAQVGRQVGRPCEHAAGREDGPRRRRRACAAERAAPGSSKHTGASPLPPHTARWRRAVQSLRGARTTDNRPVMRQGKGGGPGRPKPWEPARRVNTNSHCARTMIGRALLGLLFRKKEGGAHGGRERPVCACAFGVRACVCARGGGTRGRRDGRGLSLSLVLSQRASELFFARSLALSSPPPLPSLSLLFSSAPLPLPHTLRTPRRPCMTDLDLQPNLGLGTGFGA